jgi:phage tail sheath gpL-like
MAINFTQIPSNLRTPGVFVEVTNILANSGLSQLNTRILAIGQRLSSGTVAAGVPTLVTSKQQAVEFFGRGSMLANMFSTLFDNNPYTEKWAVALDDNGAGVAATGTATITASGSQNGTINLYIGGVRVQCAVTAGDVQNTIATNLAAAINANADLPVTAAAATNVVTLTARNKGEIGNTIDLRLNYYGVQGGEVTPTGVSIVLVQMASGATNPDISTAISALPDEIYNYWLIPYIDSSNLADVVTELESRWSPLRQIDGFAMTAAEGSVSTLTTLGADYNSQFLSIFDAAFNSPTPPHIWASALVGQVAFSATNDPALPFNTLPLVGVLPPPEADRRTISERNTLLFAGIATHKVLRDGTVVIDRLITTYQTNSEDQPDASYLDANTLFNLSYIKQDYVAFMSSKFARFKLAADGTPINPGQLITTPSAVKGEIIGRFILWELAGLVQQLDLFKQQLVVEINDSDPTRLDVLMPPTLISGLQIIATQLAFQLNFGG